MLSDSNRTKSEDLSIVAPSVADSEMSFDVELGADRRSADVRQEPGTAAWRELMPGWLSRRSDGSLPLLRTLFFYGLALPLCVTSITFGVSQGIFEPLGGTAAQGPLTVAAAGYMVGSNYLTGLILLPQTSRDGLFSQLLDDTAIDPRVMKTVQKIHKWAWVQASAVNVLVHAFAWSVYFFLTEPSARTPWITAAVVSSPAAWALLVQYGGEFSHGRAAYVALATVRYKLRDLHELAAETTPATLATDEHHDR
jgi:hypothetical protein